MEQSVSKLARRHASTRQQWLLGMELRRCRRKERQELGVRNWALGTRHLERALRRGAMRLGARSRGASSQECRVLSVRHCLLDVVHWAQQLGVVCWVQPLGAVHWVQPLDIIRYELSIRRRRWV
ncbi:unnamed protein product [Ilex paraguariensis]|uniref:Uncharacterized protein n=1 Tax=Ilex paraguariensis TaxID=185542 RepID=A0ABC8RUH3_9AQUA